jgi:ribonuclease HI
MAAYVPRPHFWLLSEPDRQHPQGGWRFILRSSDGSKALEACDWEPHARGERLELLAVVRGLEALDQPSRVTLITPSQYVKQGLAYGLTEWRENGWTWERFGQMAPVKHRDLWQRLDRALKYHQIDCRTIRIDAAHPSGGAHEGARPATLSEPDESTCDRTGPPRRRFVLSLGLRRRIRRAVLRQRRMLAEQIDAWQLWLEQIAVIPLLR